MKIMITSRGETLDSPMDERYGRAEYFIVYNTENDQFEAVKNPFLNDKGGVGISVAKFTIEQGIDALISGSFGPNAQDVISGSNIKLYQAKGGSIKEIVELFKNNKLEQFK